MVFIPPSLFFTKTDLSEDGHTMTLINPSKFYADWSRHVQVHNRDRQETQPVLLTAGFVALIKLQPNLHWVWLGRFESFIRFFKSCLPLTFSLKIN